ncbi:hypothetical protein F4776DRAFT_613511 [Hypoxylon sp. NC0597]|nr:hypothetical protein F4776DRAFT_613511 [Hypoxylon sp. NC0597]
MLSIVGRAAIRRLISAPSPTSSYRIVVSRLVATPLGCNRDFIRSLTGGTKKASTTTKTATKTGAKGATKTTTKATAKAKTKPTATKGRTKQSTKAKKPKSKAAAKSKSKASPKKREKKPLTPEKQAVLERKELKKTALYTEPKPLPDTPWKLFVVEQTKNKGGNPADLRSKMMQLAQDFRALPASEQQRLANTAEQNKVSNAAAYKAWVESHTPVEINSAIKARQQLKRKYNIPKSALKTIHDERLPKKPVNAFSLFTKARWASGDFSNASIIEASKQIGSEWKALADTERHAYEDLAKSAIGDYEKKVESVLHRPLYRRPSQTPESSSI